jgi:hypothetical protein
MRHDGQGRGRLHAGFQNRLSQFLDDRLTDAGLLFVRGQPPRSSYIFKHALVQDAAYGTLLRGRRQSLHRRIVATLEDRFADIVLVQPALLAQHCEVAGQAEKALAYRLKAGQQALARSTMAEAVAHCARGWTCWPVCRTARGGGNTSWTCKSCLDRRWLPRKAFRRPLSARPSPERAR